MSGSLLDRGRSIDGRVCVDTGIMDDSTDRNWHAIFTLPQNEKSVLKHLLVRGIESFLPTYESVRVWKNRQRVKVILPLFPTYLFVQINANERSNVLQAPGVLRILGNGRKRSSILNSEVDFLRSGFRGRMMEPYRELVIGEKVRIVGGAIKGVEGTLIRKNNNLRFVLTVQLLNQHAVIEVDAENLEPVVP